MQLWLFSFARQCSSLSNVEKKNTNPKAISSFRPISLLPDISKVFEMIIKNKVMKFSNYNMLLPDQQFRFRSRLSKTHAISSVVSSIYTHLQKITMWVLY